MYCLVALVEDGGGCIICHGGVVVVAVVVAVFVVVAGMGPAGQVLRMAPSGSFARFLPPGTRLAPQPFILLSLSLICFPWQGKASLPWISVVRASPPLLGLGWAGGERRCIRRGIRQTCLEGMLSPPQGPNPHKHDISVRPSRRRGYGREVEPQHGAGRRAWRRAGRGAVRVQWSDAQVENTPPPPRPLPPAHPPASLCTLLTLPSSPRLCPLSAGSLAVSSPIAIHGRVTSSIEVKEEHRHYQAER